MMMWQGHKKYGIVMDPSLGPGLGSNFRERSRLGLDFLRRA